MSVEEKRTFKSVTSMASELGIKRRATINERAKRAGIDLARTPLEFTEKEIQILSGVRTSNEGDNGVSQEYKRTDSTVEKKRLKQLEARVKDLEADKARLNTQLDAAQENVQSVTQLLDQAQRLQMFAEQRLKEEHAQLIEYKEKEAVDQKRGFWSKIFGG